jgi:hypothetical protein
VKRVRIAGNRRGLNSENEPGENFHHPAGAKVAARALPTKTIRAACRATHIAAARDVTVPITIPVAITHGLLENLVVGIDETAATLDSQEKTESRRASVIEVFSL